MTPLVVYPTASYNTFLDVAAMDSAAEDSLGHNTWDVLSADDKQRWLLLTGKIMKSFKGFAPAAPQDDCLASAQADLIIHQLQNALQSVEGTQQLRIRKFDILTQEYFKNTNLDAKIVDDLPPSVIECLENNGAVVPHSASGGVGTFRRRRW